MPVQGGGRYRFVPRLMKHKGGAGKSILSPLLIHCGEIAKAQTPQYMYAFSHSFYKAIIRAMSTQQLQYILGIRHWAPRERFINVYVIAHNFDS